MNKNVKIAIALGITAAATAAITVGIIRQLKAIKALTIDADEIDENLSECEIKPDETDVEDVTEATDEITE